MAAFTKRVGIAVGRAPSPVSDLPDDHIPRGRRCNAIRARFLIPGDRLPPIIVAEHVLCHTLLPHASDALLANLW